MNKTVFPPPPVITIPIKDCDQRFAVRRVFCAGRNYAGHIKEMGGQAGTLPPVFFAKPADALVSDGKDVPYPRATKDLHHEVELVLALGKPLSDANEAEAMGAIYGLAVGVDLTRRDLQDQAKARAAPWTSAKAFDHSAPIGPLSPVSEVPASLRGRIYLCVNGKRRQDGDLAQMLWPPARLLAHLSSLFDLKVGDLVFTGTPAGVGPLQIGDVVTAGIEALDMAPLRFAVYGK